MPNLIKYSTSAVTNTIKKGNIVLGVNNVDYGPTSTSGFYNGITPPISGYTFYINKPSGGPSIYVSTGDTQTIQLIQSLGGTGSTIENTLSWVASQSDIVVANKDYENIVTSGMVLNLDAGFTGSYPKGNQQWYDISGSGNTGTLTNGPTFNSLSGGSIVFDGSDDYVNLPHIFDISSGGVTWNIWFKASSTSWSPLFSDWYNNQWSFNIQVYQGNITVNIRNASNVDLSPTTQLYAVSSNTIYNLICTYDKTTKNTILYINGVLITSIPNSVSDSAIRNTTNNWSVGYKQDSGNSFFGNVYVAQIYNRALTQSEITQNFNALKNRYGL